MLISCLKKYNQVAYLKTPIVSTKLDSFLANTSYLKSYYLRNDLLWQEGMLIDFLQKKVLDKWIRRFLIHSAHILSERFIFDKLIKVYGDFVLWVGTQKNIFEFTNVASLLVIAVLPLLLIFLLLFLNYLLLAPLLV